MYKLKNSKTDGKSRLDTWDKCLGLVHWDDPEGWNEEGGGRWGSGWGTHVSPWLIHINVWQKPLQYCEVISLQLIKINEKKLRVHISWFHLGCTIVLWFVWCSGKRIHQPMQETEEMQFQAMDQEDPLQ